MSEYEQAEKAVLDAHEPAWRAQGYTVLRRPSGSSLPSFLHSYEPDALLLGRTPTVVVEVVRKGQPHVESRIRRLKELLSGHPDWRLEILYAGEEPELLPVVTTEVLQQLLIDVRALSATDARAGLLMLWSTLEALGRRIEPKGMERPQSPGRVVELLAGMGAIVPSEADTLRRVARLRNRLIHGDLEISPSERDLREALDVAESLLTVVRKREIN